MLSHLVGRSNRLDLQRLRRLEAEIVARDARIEALETRVAEKTREAADLAQRLEAAVHAERVTRVGERAGPATCNDEAESLARRLGDALGRAEGLEAALSAARDAAEVRAQAQAALAAALAAERDAAEQALTELAAPRSPSRPRIDALRVLYVGGRPSLRDALAEIARRLGGELLRHDGGVEDALSLLPGLVGRADLALMPVDCVSHAAMTSTRRLCEAGGVPFRPLRSASLSSFLAAISEWREQDRKE